MFRSTDGHLLSPAGLHPPRGPPPNPRLHPQTHISNQREKKTQLCIYKSVLLLSHMLVPVYEDIAETQVRFPEFMQLVRHYRWEGGGGWHERESPPALSSLHPAVSASLLSPPSSIPHLPPGIECSQSARWAECIIHRLFWGGGCTCMRVCVLNPGGVGCGVIIDLMAVF